MRITSIEHASDTILVPALTKLLPRYPDIRVEIINNYGLTEIVAARFDAGVRLGEQIAKDMIALRIGPDFRQVLVGAPSYLSARRRPKMPNDLTDHACINLRLPTSGGLWTWPFAKNGRELKVRTDGPLAFNAIPMILSSALAGHGLAYLPEDIVREHLAGGRLVLLLADWSPLMTGYHPYYPNRQSSPAFAALLDVLRYRKSSTRRPADDRNLHAQEQRFYPAARFDPEEAHFGVMLRPRDRDHLSDRRRVAVVGQSRDGGRR